MTELSFSKFGRGNVGAEGGDMKINARDVIQQHNANVSSFYNKPSSAEMSMSGANAGRTEEEPSRLSYYDELIQQLTNLLERHNESEDLSDIRGDTVSQLYYYGISAVLLYLLYRILYVKQK
jgi:hypothetical protein